MSYDARLRELDEAIQREPAEPGSYLLRADVLMARGRRGDDEAAAVDFYRAAELAAAQLEIEDWGINAQIVRDRALTGLNELAGRGILVETFVPVPELEPVPMEEPVELLVTPESPDVPLYESGPEDL